MFSATKSGWSQWRVKYQDEVISVCQKYALMFILVFISKLVFSLPRDESGNSVEYIPCRFEAKKKSIHSID